jgi:uncharacterized protein YndB with AHSA1/START domain
MKYTPPKQTDLTLTRTIAATPAEIYDVWLDVSSPGGPWYGADKVILEPKVDGLFYHVMSHEGRDWAHYGRFITLDRPRRIAHTWMSEATRGLESMITITLEPAGDKTLVTLHHAGVPDDELGRQHGEGWAWMLGAIEEKFANRGK